MAMLFPSVTIFTLLAVCERVFTNSAESFSVGVNMTEYGWLNLVQHGVHLLFNFLLKEI